MKPNQIVSYPERTRDALLNSGLGRLIDYLENQIHMKTELEKYFRELRLQGKEPSMELQWVHTQYDPIL